ncbi:MAG: hypothetical protein ABI035_06580 [Gemmatimonadaceae bacterium]
MRGVLRPVALLLYFAARHFGQQLLHHAACLGTAGDRLPERAPVPLNFVAFLRFEQIRVASQVGQ